MNINEIYRSVILFIEGERYKYIDMGRASKGGVTKIEIGIECVLHIGGERERGREGESIIERENEVERVQTIEREGERGRRKIYIGRGET